MATTVGTIKRCSKCGKDVTGEKRFKDAKGHYWCEACGEPQMAAVAAKSESLVNPCPKCHQPTHATHLVRKNGIYMCEQCASGTKRKSGTGDAVLSDEDLAKRKKIILAVSVLVLAAIVYYVMNVVMA